MKTASFLLIKFSLILSISLLVTLFPGVGCKSGTSVSNPFAKKPQPTDPKTPAAIDNVHITTPPEKYTKDSALENSQKEKSLAQKGKYEQYPGREKNETTKIAMNSSSASNAYQQSGSSSLSTQGSVPGFVSPAQNGLSENRTSSSGMSSSSGLQYQAGNASANNYSGSNASANAGTMPAGNYPMASSASAPMGNYPVANNQAQVYSTVPQGNSVSQGNVYPVTGNGSSGVYGISNGNSSYSANNTYPMSNNSPNVNSSAAGNNLSSQGSTASGSTFAPGSIGGF